jgi:hypothetical protein
MCGPGDGELERTGRKRLGALARERQVERAAREVAFDDTRRPGAKAHTGSDRYASTSSKVIS